MMKLGDRCIVQKSRPSSHLGVIAPWVRTPKNVALGYDVGKISAGCLLCPSLDCSTVHLPVNIYRLPSATLQRHCA